MCVQNAVKASFFIILVSLLLGCEETDAILPSAGIYRVNVQASGRSFDECSFVKKNDKIKPYFENSVYNDPDVTALMVFLKNSNGEILGGKIIYELDLDEEDLIEEEMPPLSNEVSPAAGSSVNNNNNNNNSNNNEPSMDKPVTDKSSIDELSVKTSSEISLEPSLEKSSGEALKENNKTEQGNVSKNKQERNSSKNSKKESSENTSANLNEDSSENLFKNSNEGQNEDSYDMTKSSDKGEPEFLVTFLAEDTDEELDEDLLEADDEENAQKADYYYGKNEIIIPVNNLDNNLPYFRLQDDLPMGRYTMVFQVLSGKENLYKTEKTFFYLGDAAFSFKDIQVHLPGIADSSQLLPKGAVVMLEARLDFDSRLEPYIIWYNGKKIVSEGKYSEGAGNLLLKTPEQNSFLSLRAEVFPVLKRNGLTGFFKEISSPVSLKAPYMHLLSEDTLDILHWYIFESNLNDSIKSAGAERSFKHTKKKSPQWMPYGGTYGLAAGSDIYMLSNVSFPTDDANSGQFLFRFKPLKKGGILKVQFDSSVSVTMNLEIKDEEKLILSLVSPSKTVSKTLELPKTEDFITVSVIFSVWQELLAAQIDLLNQVVENEEADEAEETEKDESVPENKPIALALAAPVERQFKVSLGDYRSEAEPVNQKVVPVVETNDARRKPVYTAIWDEFAYLLAAPLKAEIEEEPEEEMTESEENQPMPNLVLSN